MPNFPPRIVYGDEGLGSISGTVTTLPGGYVLGEERQAGGIQYRLVYNAGGASITVGLIASPKTVGGTVYSVTVTTTSEAFNCIGAVLAHNATVPTDSYFWGAFRGYIASGLIATSITQLAGNSSKLSTDGCVLPVTNTAASSFGASGCIPVAFTIASPTAGTVAVRQGGVWLNIP